MRLERTFIRVGLRVDAERLAAEVHALPDDAWIPHPEGAPGNTCVALVAAGGDHLDHATTGAMAPTTWLQQMPYHRAVLAALGAPIGRSRLMRIEPEGHLGTHVDTNRYWQEHLRVHAPIITTPEVRFTCDEETVHMAAGEVWVFDTWRRHGVDNPSTTARVHLVVDTVGSSRLWHRIDAGARHGHSGDAVGPMVDDNGDEPIYEAAAPLEVSPPWQQRVMADGIISDLPADTPSAVRTAVRDFVADWHALWVAHRDDRAARPLYDALAARFDEQLTSLPQVHLANGSSFVEAARQLLVRPGLAPLAEASSPSHPGRRAPATATRRTSSRRLDRPVFIVSSPRSGSSLLFESLARARGLFTIGGESHEVFERNPELHPANRGWTSNRLDASDVTPELATRLDETFAARARDRDGRVPVGRAPIRLLEKTPKNALRVPFLAEAFPDAGFIYLHRDPKPTISSMLDAWRSERFVTYRGLPGWGTAPWSMLLVPGWERSIGMPLEEVAARQWATTVEMLLDDLADLPAERWCAVTHEEMLADPNGVVGALAERMGLQWDRPLPEALPNSKSTLDAPAADKWRRNEEAIERVWHLVAPTAEHAATVAASPVGTMRMAGPSTKLAERVQRQRAAVQAAGHEAFRSVHTSSVAELLAKAGMSVIATTYQSGRVVLLRPSADGAVNTHLKAFPRPMGVAVRRDTLALGTSNSVWQFDNQPTLAARLPGDATHDACFVARAAHITGDIAIHEMAYDRDGELWVVNTRFSCLATLDPEYSFVPKWRPRFVTALAAEDRCHLNGLAMVDGRPKYVTALAMTDDRQGWRAEKAGGGLIIDIDDHAVITTGMTMPHSPRWHGGRLWVLDSGNGALCTVDVATGNRTVVALLPGFTRGLAFIGRYALVGLSKVREHVFAGLPLAERVTERQCGVWVVDTDAGIIVGFLRFEGAVEEVFDVQVVPYRYPELLEPTDALGAGAFVLPEENLADLRGR
ncbi:MAG TPA: TIGR03032 family protein [Acidimicrobiaceae bacterium]|nr:TIGR03032 family protein [Acidimicrobiaceae bacterium]